ncbi:DUF4738 domain-containing protein [Pontimicrobium sp. SW4]|uniref:DUF4738 domain-containing protein n=1 Tax=Pontimicrobium sp. SW4 TaxID=3153519 RepID=A0AAU7BXZ7_9FLAO
MKYILALFMVSFVFFTSCDGKDRAKKTSKEILEDSNLSPSFFEQVSYIPEQYSEEIVDTTFSNGFKISTKYFSDMNNNVLNEFEIDTIHYKHYYREFITELTVEFQEKKIFSKTIDKSLFENKDDAHFWEQSIMLGLFIDKELTDNDKLFTVASFCIPESEICKDFRLVIANNGDMEIIELKTEEVH